MRKDQNTHVVIIDTTTDNNLRVIPIHLRTKYSNNTEVANGNLTECNRFNDSYDQHNFYPIVEQEELQ